jgi:hypothetical protein
MKPASVFLPSLLLVAGLAVAATPEEEYVKARDGAIARIGQLEARKGPDTEIRQEEESALAGLEKRLREIVGDLAARGYPAEGRITLETFSEDGLCFGLLDGLRFSRAGGTSEVVVTTDGLLERWLARAGFWRESRKAPPSPNEALRAIPFYTEAVGHDAHFARSANIPIAAPEGVTLAVAYLGGWAQDVGPGPGQTIVVALRKAGRVYIAQEDSKHVKKIPACEATWQKALESEASGTHAGASQDREERADRDYHACYVARAPKEAWFEALTREAQEIAGRFKGR